MPENCNTYSDFVAHSDDVSSGIHNGSALGLA